MKVVVKVMLGGELAATFLAPTYLRPAVQTMLAAIATTSPLPASAQTTAATAPLSTVHFGTEIWTATDHGSGESANYDYVIGDGSDIHLIGIYGNAALDNAKPDGNDREFLFSISSANNPGSAQLVGSPYDPSHHSADPAIYAGILKQAGGNNATLPINVTFPGSGIVIARGAVRIAAVTGVYNPDNGFQPIAYPATSAVLSSELHLTFVYTK